MISRRQVLAAGVFAPWALAASSAAGGGGLVRLLIDTPRESLLAALAARIRDGLAPAELLRALAIAACREVSPYPNVGFKYHAVMMLQSVQLSMAALPGELILRRNNIIAVHANTMANAMHYCYVVSDVDSAQRLLLLQAVAFMARFRALVDRDWRARDRRIDAIELLPAASVDEIFQTLGRSRFRAVRQALGWLDAGGDPATLAARARWYATLKITGTHDIKVTEAMQENYGWLRFPWRNALLAASLMYANASTAPDDDVVARARALIGFGRTTGSS